MLSFACKNETKAPPTSTDASQTAMPAPPESPKPEVYLYWVSVDKLNLREQPNKDAKVVTQFAEGDFVESQGEVSANKEEATLRNIPYNEPYFKVTSTTPEQYNGWAYSAALTPVYAGPRHTSPDLGRLTQFSMFLKTLSIMKLDSGKKAWDYANQNFSNAQGTLADAAFMMLETFLFSMETRGDFYEQAEKVKWTDDDFDAVNNNKFDMNKYPETRAFAAAGFGLSQGEGSIFPIVDWNKLGAFFLNRVTPPMKSYIEEITIEKNTPMWDDGGITIPIEQIADHGAFWENFNKANPYFVRGDEAKMLQRSMVWTLIWGADNTPAFSYDDQTLTEDFKKAWAYTLQKYSGTEIAKAVKEVSDLLAAEGGKKTKKVEDLMQKYVIE